MLCTQAAHFLVSELVRLLILPGALFRLVSYGPLKPHGVGSCEEWPRCLPKMVPGRVRDQGKASLPHPWDKLPPRGEHDGPHSPDCERVGEGWAVGGEARMG